MYDVAFCVRRVDLADDEYRSILHYMDKMSRKDHNDGDIIETISMTPSYIFGVVDRDDVLYKMFKYHEWVEWNE